MSDRNPSGALQRRTVVAGAAWTIPVVATAIGAPLAAASDPVTPPAPAYNVALAGAINLTPNLVTRNTPMDVSVPIRVTGPDTAEWVELEFRWQSIGHNPQGPVLRGFTAPHGFSLVRGFQTVAVGGASDHYVYRAYNVPPSDFTFQFRTFVNPVIPPGGPHYVMVTGVTLRAPAGHGGSNGEVASNTVWLVG